METLGQLLTEEHNIRLDQAITLQAVRDPFLLYSLSHQIIWVTGLALDAAVSSETAMSFHDLLRRHTGVAF